MKALSPIDLTLIFNGVFFVILLVLAILLITRIGKRRSELSQIAVSKSVAFPFPQRPRANENLTLPSESSEVIDDQVRQTYQAWLDTYILLDQEPGRAFLRIGVEKNWLRYQVTATSFGQALAMLIAVLMAGEDAQAQNRFDQLLALCLSHGSADAANLMSWQVMPDVVPGRRLEADLNSEIWLSFAIMAGAAQWGKSERFNYSSLARLRLEALLPYYQHTADAKPEELIYSPYFYQIFGLASGNQAWKGIKKELSSQAEAQLAQYPHLEADGSAEDAKLSLLMMQLGLAALWQGNDFESKLPSGVEELVQDACARFAQAEQLNEISFQSEPAGFSKLSLLACCVPAALVLQDQDLVNQLWQAFNAAQPGRHDPLGATLRLLGLLLLSGNVWFDRVLWKELPELSEE